jgi:Predicted ATPase
MSLLTGGLRADDRHSSMRSALDWSYSLLDEVDQAVLRRVCVFAAPFTAAAAEAVCGAWPPVSRATVATAVARLADHNLLVTVADAVGTRYRALETIRQYGASRLVDEGEAEPAYAAHLTWCLDVAGAIGLPHDDDLTWRRRFDDVVDELRAAVAWATAGQSHRRPGYRLAIRLAELAFARGWPGEAQARYEQAAALAEDAGDAAAALRGAAGAAKARHAGDDALRLHLAAADAAIQAGDRAGAAADLAYAAEMCHRARGLMATAPPAGLAAELLARGQSLVDGEVTAEPRLLIAAAYAGIDDDPADGALVEQAVALARRAGDALTESAALDALTSVQLARGELRRALASARRRVDILDPLAVTATSALEVCDALYMAAECATAVGDLPVARVLAERIQHLPFHREEGHLATARLIVVTALAGDWDQTLALADRFREGWERAGRPRAGNLTRAACAAAAVHGLRGDEAARGAWLDVAHALATPGRPLSAIHVDEFFDALLLLHRGRAEAALDRVETPPEQFRTWYSGMWRPWYAAVWAEAAALTGRPDTADRIRRARLATADNPVAAAIVQRAEALAGEPGAVAPSAKSAPPIAALAPVAAALEAAGCRYQWARTLVAMGGRHRARGEAVLAAMGATPMEWPPVRA